MNIIKPTVGRKVWYRPSKHDKVGPIPMSTAGDQPLDATIIAVWGDRMVNVMIIDTYGKQFPKTSIKLLQEGDTPDLDANGDLMAGHVEWMPYQQGQGKSNSLQAKP